MILKTQKNKLSRVLKNNFIPEVQSLLEARGVVTKNGKPYCKAMISHVYNGRNGNEKIEIAILDVYNARKNKQTKLSVLYSEILETKKPEAATSGLN